MFLMVSWETQPTSAETVIRLEPSNFIKEFLVNRNNRLLLEPCPVNSGVSSLPGGTWIKSAVCGVGVSVFQKRDRVFFVPVNQTSSLSVTVIA